METLAPELTSFIDQTRQILARNDDPADCVEALTPLMYRLLEGDTSFLQPAHFRADPGHYLRNAIYVEPGGGFSLYALVWSPGQRTPIHDHGSWGVAGVLEGVLHERNFIRVDRGGDAALDGIELLLGGVIVHAPGTVTGFVPNPESIHLTGNTHSSGRVVSLHLYGRAMGGFYIYDRVTGTRHRSEVEHNES